MITQYFRKFFQSSESSGMLLMAALAVSLLIANSSLAAGFHHFLEYRWGNETLQLRFPVHIWVNDGLMAVFFLLVGLEIKRELLHGELSSVRSAMLPILAAIGGMLFPAGIFALMNHGTAYAGGWGIPMATDIAFSLAIIAMLGRGIPSSLKIFLAALAIADDLGAILVIALFYTRKIHFTFLALAAAVFVLQMIFNYFKIKKLYFYLVPGLFLWYFLHQSGIHATIAGVLTALAIPAKSPQNTPAPLEILEERLHLPVNYLIMPIFALANTNITFHGGMVDHLLSRFSLGILLGLGAGKVLGICTFSFLAIKCGIAVLPYKARWRHMIGLGFLAGIGFTMSIFIASICFRNPEIRDEAKFAVLTASAVSGMAGYFILKNSGRKRSKKMRR